MITIKLSSADKITTQTVCLDLLDNQVFKVLSALVDRFAQIHLGL